MIIALGVLTVTLLITAAVMIAVLGNTQTSRHDIDGKRAYAAALAGVNAYTYELNQNPSYWATCSNDTLAKTAVPGSTTGEQYSWAPVLANGATSCNTSNPEASLIDLTTGTLRMEFTGYSGSGTVGDPTVSRTIVTSFGKLSPLDFVWYTVYEELDPAIPGYSSCASSGTGIWLRAGTRPSSCNIEWASVDQMNGPMYTQDQYLIAPGASPTFGRNANDLIESMAPTSDGICAQANSGGGYTQDSCGSANIKGTAVPGAPTIGIPQTNSQLYTDAQAFGATYTGVTYVTLNGGSATVQNCPTSTCTTATISLSTDPIIYVSNGSGCTPYTYDPFQVTYYTSGCYGDVYVSGNYTSPVTIAAANNIIIDGAITTTTTSGVPSGTATMGLVANDFIRVMHGVQNRSNSLGGCSSGSTQASNISSETFSNLTIDAAIVALDHSFIVDNFDCGATLGTLSVNGAIVQDFRGAVALLSGSNPVTGYAKDYTYDDRLAALLPPYMFDIDIADWNPTRETLCTAGASAPTGC